MLLPREGCSVPPNAPLRLLCSVSRVQTPFEGWRPRTTVEVSVLGLRLPPGGGIWEGTGEGRRRSVSSRGWDRISRVRGQQKPLCGSALRPPFSSFPELSRGPLDFQVFCNASRGTGQPGAVGTASFGLSFPSGLCVAREQEEPPSGASASCTLCGTYVWYVCVCVCTFVYECI